MKISIITATYNSAATVRDTIESVLRQTYQNYEYIIKDGGSKDTTLDICREYAPKFNGKMRIISSRDKGIYDAMNQGFQAATGDVLCLINSDDLFSRSDSMQLVVNAFEEDKLAECVYADLYYVAANDINRIVRVWETGEQKPFRKGWLPAHPTFYVKRAVYENYGYFDLNYPLAADFELMLRFVEKHHIRLHYLPEKLVKMRLGGATSKNVKNIIRQNKECIKAFRDNDLQPGPFYTVYRMIPKIKQFLKKGE